MLKNLGYDGAYHDENISVSVLLENPVEYGIDAAQLVFSVALRANNRSHTAPHIDDFTFYIIDETHYIYNTQYMPYSKPAAEELPDDEPIRQPDGLIHTELKHKFLFQDLRIAFYYRPYKKINIIDLKR